MPTTNDLMTVPGLSLARIPPVDAKSIKVGITPDIYRFSAGLVDNCRKLGIELTDVGIVHTEIGFAVATKAAMLRCIEKLDARLQEGNPEEIYVIAAALSKLAQSVDKLSSKNIVDGQPNWQKGPPRRSFAPGQNVRFHVHHHNDKTSEEQKP